MTSISDIPTAHTPPGGYGSVMPAPILGGCTDALVAEAPDLRGIWKVVSGESGGSPLQSDHPIWLHIERVEQVGNRVVVTSGGVIHDMVVDGTYESGLHDVMAIDFATPIEVAASYEQGVLVLRPKNLGDVEVRRWREGEFLIWEYHNLFTVRMKQIDR